MYGIINRAIEDMVTASHGENAWMQIKAASGVQVDYFLSNEPYDDGMTYKLVAASSEVLQIPMSEVLSAFGEWWVLKTGREKYGGLMEAGGKNLQEFLLNLPMFHSRIMLFYPKLNPPEFRIGTITESSIEVHYYSTRKGLHHFVLGLLQGLAKMYHTPVTIQVLSMQSEPETHEIFQVNW